MKEKLTEYFTEYPFYVGSLFLILGISYLIYKIAKRESFKMMDYSAAGWKGLINSWAFAILLVIIGIALIFQ
ncbi:hypothetical protein GCM10007103_00030 [Salinimicrobium marinum]|uniref:Uncharacterized protein n=1 Tax=Salinimicrobium marinum TaxID=680283 RepID=A0A918S442_9FLAO|nr:hypothetical protein [Salinimicrobium marinum]GHA22967.1 hypothetical protein GCM10007103_00030 [Salinimicrobium marinum]